jgi:hypothetical protein
VTGPIATPAYGATVAAMLDEAITWGDLLIVLAVLALIAIVAGVIPRRRR